MVTEEESYLTACWGLPFRLPVWQTTCLPFLFGQLRAELGRIDPRTVLDWQIRFPLEMARIPAHDRFVLSLSHLIFTHVIVLSTSGTNPMNRKIVSLHITSKSNEDGAPVIDTVEDLTLHCAHIQNRNEVVITLNPNITGYSDNEVETTWTHEATFRIFDIHRKQTHRFSVAGKKYEIEFLTWSRPKEFTLRFDFEVRYD